MNAEEEILLQSQNELKSITSPAESITVTRNETTESMTAHDDTNKDTPTKHKEGQRRETNCHG